MELKELCELNGTSGNEDLVRKAVLSECKKNGADCFIDRAGNVIAFKAGSKKDNKKHILFSAHMDEVGFIVLNATEDGYLSIAPVGGIDPRVCVSKYVSVGASGVIGVIGAMAIHLQSEDDRKRVLKWNDLYVDIGAKDKSDAEACCPPGSYIYFDEPYETFGDGYAVSKALDDRAGCFNLLRILERQSSNDITCAFVVKEEVGCKGSLAASFNSTCDAVLILETTAANDLNCKKNEKKVCILGDGVAVSFMDKSSIANRALFDRVIEIANKNDIHYQIKNGVTGQNDAMSFQTNASGKATCVLSNPCRYLHGPSSVVKLSDIEDQFAICLCLADEL